MKGFVQVTADNLHVDGKTFFFFVGTNAYHLLTRSSDPASRREVLDLLDGAVDLGLTVIRTWAFNDGANQWQALQTAPGRFREDTFAGLDWLLSECNKRELRVVLTLVNYWNDYGGMLQYARWRRAGRNAPECTADDFYDDAQCQTMFRNYLRAMTSRTNTITGRRYADDPTILAWELANEPRCEGDASGDTIQRWVEDTSAFLKSLDPNHLVSVGTEGFFGASTPDLLKYNPYSSAVNHGTDFARLSQCPTIDFCSIHMYPDHWCADQTPQQAMAFCSSWLDSHMQVAAAMQKPLVLGEFGKRAKGDSSSVPVDRSTFYAEVLSICLQHARFGGCLAGAMFWMLSTPDHHCFDGFALYTEPRSSSSSGAGASLPPGGGSHVHSEVTAAGPIAAPLPSNPDAETLRVIREYALQMQRLCVRVRGANTSYGSGLRAAGRAADTVVESAPCSQEGSSGTCSPAGTSSVIANIRDNSNRSRAADLWAGDATGYKSADTTVKALLQLQAGCNAACTAAPAKVKVLAACRPSSLGGTAAALPTDSGPLNGPAAASGAAGTTACVAASSQASASHGQRGRVQGGLAHKLRALGMACCKGVGASM